MTSGRTGFVPFIAAFFAEDFYLGDTHNAVEGKKVMPSSQDNLIVPDDQETARTQVTPVKGQGPDVKRRVGVNWTGPILFIHHTLSSSINYFLDHRCMEQISWCPPG